MEDMCLSKDPFLNIYWNMKENYENLNGKNVETQLKVKHLSHTEFIATLFLKKFKIWLGLFLQYLLFYGSQFNDTAPSIDKILNNLFFKIFFDQCFTNKTKRCS